MVRLIIADNNQTTLSSLGALLCEQHDIRVVKTASDGPSLEHALKTRDADVLLMDLALPVIDGLEILRRLQLNAYQHRPNAVVLTSISSDHIIQHASRLGAAYYMVKPCDHALVRHRILEACQGDRHLRPVSGGMDSTIADMLLSQGISGAFKGGTYLHSALNLCLSSDDRAMLITKDVYPGIAKRFGTDPQKVERAMRTSIHSAWTRGSLQRGGMFDKRPSNGEFLARILVELRQQAPMAKVLH